MYFNGPFSALKDCKTLQKALVFTPECSPLATSATSTPPRYRCVITRGFTHTRARCFPVRPAEHGGQQAGACDDVGERNLGAVRTRGHGELQEPHPQKGRFLPPPLCGFGSEYKVG